MQRIVCAAVKFEDGTVVLGPRHFDETMGKIIEKLNIFANGRPKHVQGFVDQFGHFLTREDALVVATNANQLIRKVDPKDKLYSEDLY